MNYSTLPLHSVERKRKKKKKNEGNAQKMALLQQFFFFFSSPFTAIVVLKGRVETHSFDF